MSVSLRSEQTGNVAVSLYSGQTGNVSVSLYSEQTGNISVYTQGRHVMSQSVYTQNRQEMSQSVYTQDRQAISQVGLPSEQRGVRSQSYCTDNTVSLSTSQAPIHITELCAYTKKNSLKPSMCKHIYIYISSPAFPSYDDRI